MASGFVRRGHLIVMMRRALAAWTGRTRSGTRKGVDGRTEGHACVGESRTVGLDGGERARMFTLGRRALGHV